VQETKPQFVGFLRCIRARIKKIGNWTTSKELLKLVIDQFTVVERTAYRKIENEVKEGGIRKLTLPDGGVLYGLPNWPLDNIDLKLVLKIWQTHIRDKEATAAQLTAWAKFIEAIRDKKSN
jgi:hypothetical protein